MFSASGAGFGRIFPTVQVRLECPESDAPVIAEQKSLNAALPPIFALFRQARHGENQQGQSLPLLIERQTLHVRSRALSELCIGPATLLKLQIPIGKSHCRRLAQNTDQHRVHGIGIVVKAPVRIAL